MNQIKTNNGLKGGLLKGKPHYDSEGNSLGGIKAIVTDSNNKPVELEGEEVIINKKSVKSEKVLTVKGTPKEILSTINQLDGNGVAIGDEEAEILTKYRTGGKVGESEINKLSINNFEEYLEKKYNSKVELADYKKYIYLSRIEVPKEIRDLGIGSEIMSEIINYADYNDKKITLTPSTDYGATSISRLKEFYKKFGFIENKGKNKDFEISQLMYRLPESNKFKTGGELIKRADGSYSKRGLWDNIRDNVGSGRKPTKQMLEQEAKIKAKYHLGGDMSKHLAPNGKPSNLNHEQWHLVRNPEFKAWFGDWENDPENSSKVIDENGEPLVVYHGTPIDFEKGIGEIIFKINKDGAHFGNKEQANDFFPLKIYECFLNIRNIQLGEDQEIAVNKIIESVKSEYGTDFLSAKMLKEVELLTPSYRDQLSVGFDGLKYINIMEGDQESFSYVVFKPNQIKLADGTNTTFDVNNDDIRYREGGSIKPNFSKMSNAEIKEFYNSPEGKKLDAETYSEWKKLVNMTKSELEKFYNSEEGKKAGLTPQQASEQGIDSGRESARWVMKMKDVPYTEWSSDMWIWAKKQISFIKRMSGMKGDLYDENGNKTRKHTALLIWGHNPENKFAGGGEIDNSILINGYVSVQYIYINDNFTDEICLITYNSGGENNLNVNDTMNATEMLKLFVDELDISKNDSMQIIYDHRFNSNRIDSLEELNYCKNNFKTIIVDRDRIEFTNVPKKLELGGGISSEKFDNNFEELLLNEGWNINYYNSISTDVVPKESATEINIYRLEPYYESHTLKLPLKMKITFDWVMNKINKDKVYKSFSEDFNKLLKNKGYEKINAYPTTYGIGIFVGFGLNIEETKEKVEELLKSLDIDYNTEYSDAKYVFRYKISKSKENINKIEKIDSKINSQEMFEGDGVEETNNIPMEYKEENEDEINIIGGLVGKKEIFYAQTIGKKYEIKAYDNLTYETFKNGSSNGGGSALDKQDLKYRLDKMIKGSSEIDGINYLIVKDNILENKEYDYTDYESVKSLTKSLIEKYDNEKDSKGKKNKGTKINIETLIDSLYRLVNENPSKYLEDFIDFNNELPKSFNIPSYLIFQKDDYSNNEGIINYLVESKKNPFEFYDIVPYKLPKTKNFKVSPNDSVFMDIHDEFIGNDPLRPIMTGTYFSEKGVVSTNAHILLFTKNRGGEDKFEGVYCHTKKCIEENKDVKIEGKFPNYEMVIPSTQDYSKNINAEYLLTYLKNANKYKIFNAVTHATVFTFETSEGFYKIGVNTEFLARCIEAMIELGHKEISLNFIDPNRAITITPKGKTNEDARYLGTDFALCMPIKIDLFKDIYVYIYDLDTNCSSYEYNNSIFCFDLQQVERESFKKEIKEVKELKEQLKSELAKGTKHEMEHLETLKKVAEREITPEQAVVETAKTHISENPEYYEDLAKMELEALKDKLKSQGYNVTIPSGGNRISVMGYGKGFFNAKKQKAESILSSLKYNGYNAISKLDSDGYYDFWVYADEPKQDLAKMESENEEFKPFVNGFEYKIPKSGIEGSDKVVYAIEVYYKRKFQFGYAYMYDTPEQALNSMLKRISKISISNKYFKVRNRWRLIITNNRIQYFEDFESEEDLKNYKNDLEDLIEYAKNKIINKPFVIESKGFDYVNKSLSERKKLLKQMESDLEEREGKLKSDLKQEESIPDLIEGLEILAETLEGSEKKEIEDTIEGLKILLEIDAAEVIESKEPIESFKDKENDVLYTVEKDENGKWTVFSVSPKWNKRNEYPYAFTSKEDAIMIAKLDAGIEKEEDPEKKFMNKFDKYAEGGELENKSMIFEPTEKQEDQEKRIMENQFGKNI